jgi:capsid protein
VKTAIRGGLLSRSEAISAFGYDAEDIDREIAADNQRADQLGLVLDTDPRRDPERLSDATSTPGA